MKSGEACMDISRSNTRQRASMRILFVVTPFRACLAICWGMLLVSMQAGGADVTAGSVPQYDQIFQQTNGWAGADGDFAVTLTNDLTLWLFSDTFIGEVQA